MAKTDESESIRKIEAYKKQHGGKDVNLWETVCLINDVAPPANFREFEVILLNSPALRKSFEEAVSAPYVCKAP